MKLSTKSRYGARILVELARHPGERPIQVNEIARLQDIPAKYLEQLIRTLRIAGLVSSVRGARGGHFLNVAPDTVTLADVVRLFETQDSLVDCVPNPENCQKAVECKLRVAWGEATNAMYDSLSKVRISDLAFGNSRCSS